MRTSHHQYAADAEVHRQSPPAGEGLMDPEARARIVAQFDRQAAEANKLADEIEQAETILANYKQEE